MQSRGRTPKEKKNEGPEIKHEFGERIAKSNPCFSTKNKYVQGTRWNIYSLFFFQTYFSESFVLQRTFSRISLVEQQLKTAVLLWRKYCMAVDKIVNCENDVKFLFIFPHRQIRERKGIDFLEAPPTHPWHISALCRPIIGEKRTVKADTCVSLSTRFWSTCVTSLMMCCICSDYNFVSQTTTNVFYDNFRRSKNSRNFPPGATPCWTMCSIEPGPLYASTIHQ